jgi:hypothetical protein
LPQARAGSRRLEVRRGLLIMVVSAFVAVGTEAAQFSIDAVKAAYLFRFASYVEWPEATRDAPAFVIGVVGAEDVAVHLESLLTGMSVRGKPAMVRRVSTAAQLDGVHILYVGARVFRSSRPLRVRAREKPILIVTDAGDGLADGGVINFIEVNRNLRFEISLEAAARSSLKIDAALLSVAARVDMSKK